MASPSTIITLERPPVVEVALAAQFPPNTFDQLKIVRYADRVADTGFGSVQSQPPLGRMVEEFGVRRPEIRLEIQGSPSQRLWLLEDSGERLLQLQHDRFGVNWRKLPEGGDYPRYGKLRALLEEQLRALELLHGERLDSDLCEVTYINHIDGNRDLAEVTTLAAARRKRGFLPPMESGQLISSWVIPGADAEPSGRLHLTIAPALRAQDLSPITVLNVTARGKSLGQGVDGILGFVDIGREWAARGFRELTTTRMHRDWGLVEEEQR